jgi:hypothetical protein
MATPAANLHDWALTLEGLAFVDIIALVYPHHLKMVEKQRFGDKTPIYYEIVAQLTELYPGAKLIHLVRDGRDGTISFIDVGRDHYYQRAEFEWARAMGYQCRNLAFHYADQIIEVKYEDLATNSDVRSGVFANFLARRSAGQVWTGGSLPIWFRLVNVTRIANSVAHSLRMRSALHISNGRRSNVSSSRLACIQISSSSGDKLNFPGRVRRPLLHVPGRLL